MRAELVHVDADILPIDFEGKHLLIDGTLAFLYNLHRTYTSEQRAQEVLYPWLIRAKKKSDISTPENVAQTL